ncbi:MAG TPA: cell division protein SepF [Actinomycetota bacterium]|jgi:cell division inhibitor SepF|nr:cell division protein SepF [Actinomycetota bacterium]
MAGVWRKTLVYLGLVEEDDADDYGYDDDFDEEPQRKSPVRRMQEPQASARSEGVVRAMPRPAPAAAFHLVSPSSFNDAQEIGDKFRDGFSVIMNLQAADPELARRIVDFASGLAYGLEGSMQPVADKVFLITPRGVQVSAEERRRFLEERGFFNQA